MRELMKAIMSKTIFRGANDMKFSNGRGDILSEAAHCCWTNPELIKNQQSFVLVLSDNYRIVYACPSAFHMLGLQEAELLGCNFLNYLDGKDIVRVLGDNMLRQKAAAPFRIAPVNQRVGNSRKLEYAHSDPYSVGCVQVKCVIHKRNSGVRTAVYKPFHMNVRGFDLKDKTLAGSCNNRRYFVASLDLLQDSYNRVILLNDSFRMTIDTCGVMLNCRRLGERTTDLHEIDFRLAGISIYDIVHPDDIQTLHGLHSKILQLGYSDIILVRLRFDLKDAVNMPCKHVWFEITGKLINSSQHNIRTIDFILNYIREDCFQPSLQPSDFIWMGFDGSLCSSGGRPTSSADLPAPHRAVSTSCGSTVVYRRMMEGDTTFCQQPLVEQVLPDPNETGCFLDPSMTQLTADPMNSACALNQYEQIDLIDDVPHWCLSK